MSYRLVLSLVVAALSATSLAAEPSRPKIDPLVRVVDANLDELCEVELCDGTKTTVKVLKLDEVTDSIRDAVRQARVQVEVNGKSVWLTSANYELPAAVAGVRIDCPVTCGYLKNSNKDAWGLDRDVRLRLWPADSPLIRPGTFVYPVKQRWFATDTQMANEPCYVNACEKPSVRKIYYHYGLDFGGCEGLVDVVAATDGLVVSSRTERLSGYDDTPVRPRYDVIYVLDGRGWFYRYSHLYEIDKQIRPGAKVKAGQRLGVLGKEGGSGGWTHLHFDVFCRMPSGKWGCQEAYGFAWEAYQRQYRPKLIAVARPHHVAWSGETVTLDATRSWASEGIERYEWRFTDGTAAEGPKVRRCYDRPGYFSEILKVTDAAGRIDYDFAVVHVQDREHPESLPPAIHAAYAPTTGIKPGDEVTFKVRTFATTDGEETWDFGDGSPPVTSKSDGNVHSLAKDGYAVVRHRYLKPGHYLVRVERFDRQDRRATCHLQVRVGHPPQASDS